MAFVHKFQGLFEGKVFAGFQFVLAELEPVLDEFGAHLVAEDQQHEEMVEVVVDAKGILKEHLANE